jgi:hypothetical protein
MKKLIPSILCIFLLFFFLQPAYGAAAAPGQQPKAPSFPWEGDWINAPSLNRSVFKDKITLVYFLDYTSIYFIRELKILKEWYEKYKTYGFRVICVHAPEYEFTKGPHHVERALQRFGISWPVFLDNDFKLWDAYGTRSWPTKYLIGGDGRVFYTRVGEGKYIETEEKIREGLRKLASSVLLPKPFFFEEPLFYNLEKCGAIMMETPIGYKRFKWWGGEIANKKWVDPDTTVLYKDRGDRVERGFFVEGLWTNAEEGFIHARQTDRLTDYIGLLYQSREVYAVVNPTQGGVARIYVTRDGEPVSHDQRGVDLHQDADGKTYFLMQEPRLYYLILNDDDHWHEIRLWTKTKGVSINSFSFSNRCLSNFDHL